MMYDGKNVDKIVIGGDGFVYENLDVLVFDMVGNFMELWYVEDLELVVVCGWELLVDKYFFIINQFNCLIDMFVLDMIVS